MTARVARPTTTGATGPEESSDTPRHPTPGEQRAREIAEAVEIWGRLRAADPYSVGVLTVHPFGY